MGDDVCAGKMLGLKIGKCQKLTLSKTGVALYRGAVFPVKKFRVSKVVYRFETFVIGVVPTCRQVGCGVRRI